MKRRQTDSDAPFRTIEDTARMTGLSRDYIRRGVKAGEIPAIRSGSSSNAPYLVDTVLFLAQLHHEASEGVRT